MHIKLLYRKVLYVFLSLMIVFANTQTAFAASSWSVSNAVSAGSRTVVTATKSGYKSAVNIAPTAGRLALKLGKGANWASLAYAAIQLAPDLADIKSFQPDYANNRVKYSLQGVPYWAKYSSTAKRYSTADQACNDFDKPGRYGNQLSRIEPFNSGKSVNCWVVYTTGDHPSQGKPFINITYHQYEDKSSIVEYIPIITLASQVIKNAAAGHADSQAATREAAAEMVITGDFDRDLLAGAVPITDTKPLIPAVPGNGNGNVTHGGDVAIGEDGTTGATPGQAADDARAAAEAAAKAGDAAKDAAKDAAEQAAKDAADAQDLINSGADQAAIDAANDRAAAAEKAAADSKAVADAAKDAAAEAAKASDRAAQAAAEKAAADAKAAKDAADAAVEAVKDAAVADKAAAEAKATEAVKAADKARAEAEARAKAAEEAAKAADRAAKEAEKPFELPAFCSWATPVCDYMTWARGEYAGMKEWLTVEAVESVDENVSITETIEDGWQDKVNAGYVSFQAQCPDNVLIPVSLMGASQNLNISYTPFCHFASLIKPAVILGAWISGLLIISGGRGRE